MPSPDAPFILSIALASLNAFEASVNLMMSPVPRKFPDIKLVFSEGGIGWIPAALERADRQFLRHRLWADMADNPLPSEVFRRNMWVCMIEEPIGITFREHIGVDRILWECDYPHADTPWPYSQKQVAEEFADVPRDEVEAITHGNAEALFRWPLDRSGMMVDVRSPLAGVRRAAGSTSTATCGRAAPSPTPTRTAASTW